jgi:hypothetical protein
MTTRRQHGFPGHFTGCYSCCFRLHTSVPGYRISTVGCYHPRDDRNDGNGTPVEIGHDRLFETMVFEQDDTGVPSSMCEIDFAGYNDATDAELGHEAMVQKYEAKS